MMATVQRRTVLLNLRAVRDSLNAAEAAAEKAGESMDTEKLLREIWKAQNRLEDVVTQAWAKEGDTG